MNAVFKLAKYLKPYWLWAILAPLLMLIEVAMDLMQPRMIQRIIDQGIGQQNLNLVIQTGFVMGPLTNFVNNVGFAIIAGTGGWMAVRGLASVGTIAAFVSYAR